MFLYLEFNHRELNQNLVKEANKKRLNVKLSINDSKYYQYHRNNGVSKIGLIDPNS